MEKDFIMTSGFIHWRKFSEKEGKEKQERKERKQKKRKGKNCKEEVKTYGRMLRSLELILFKESAISFLKT